MATKQITEPPGGMRDFLPGDVRRREHVLGVVRRVYTRYGFEPLETPTMERVETLLGKYGEEGDRLIFRVMHRGDGLGRALEKTRALPVGEPGAMQSAQKILADMALRYDLTVPLARVVAEYHDKLPKFFKRYQVQPVWRADRPARGRFREFYQCDVDIVGSESLVCEVEVASAICDVLDELGFTDYRVRLNHRALLRGMIESAGVPVTSEVDAITALDKLDKVGEDGVRAELQERGVTDESARALLDRARMAQQFKGDDAGLLKALGDAVASSEAGRRGVAELGEMLRFARETPCGKRLSLDPSLARGLSYYTGPIFEVQVADLPGSLGGGGRYDELVGMFLGRKVPAVGFSLGLERILVVMGERGMFPALDAASQVMVFRIDGETTAETLRVLTAIRAAGISAELYPNVEKLGKQFQYAQARGVKVVCFIGARERDEGRVAFKVLASQQQVEGSLADPVATLRGLL